MPYFDMPPGHRVLREFVIRRDKRGRWIASETHGLPGGVFLRREEALRFALYEADGDATRVHVEPAFDIRTHIPRPACSGTPRKE
jgi:hypothetical protein